MWREKYHYFALENYQPFLIQFRSRRYFGLYRKAVWQVMKRDSTMGLFISRWFFGHLQWYHGDAKCDGGLSKTHNRIVMTDEPSELLAFRWRKAGPSVSPEHGTLPDWDNMGGT